MKSVNACVRIITAVAAITVPVILLCGGVFGSFLFTFSIPLFWQVALRGKSFESLGFKTPVSARAIAVGIVSGIALGIIGGELMRRVGLANFSFDATDTVGMRIGPFVCNFSLAKELGYQLLAHSNSIKGALLYIGFNIFLIGLGEELFWRGFIQRKAALFVKNVPAAIGVTALLFAAIHFYIFAVVPVKVGMVFLGLIAFAGGVWGYCRERFDSIWAPAISHGITAAIIWKLYFFRFS